MNPDEAPIRMHGGHDEETLVRRLLRSLDKAKRLAVMHACGWEDESSISQVISGRAGIKLEQLDALLGVLGLSIQEDEYMDYLRKGNTIGANCCRASASLGYCKAR
ncbi:hypothetical protein [Bordetella trematum]|uniref:hypothetical protein n=1 Tax=Bordetella trematum TaxID=123899 RepID=UPI0012678BFA|nr:hypothetical protein [Bordetella trematum]